MFLHNNTKTYNKLDLDKSISLKTPQFGKNNAANLRFLFNTSRVSFQAGPLKKKKKKNTTKNQPNTKPPNQWKRNSNKKRHHTHPLLYRPVSYEVRGWMFGSILRVPIHWTHTYKGKTTTRPISAPCSVERKQINPLIVHIVTNSRVTVLIYRTLLTYNS